MVKTCTKRGTRGWTPDDSNKCFIGKGAKAKAVKKETKKVKKLERTMKFGRPDRWEVLAIILYSLSLYLFNDIVNIMSARGGYQITAGLISGLQISLVPLMWTAFVTFHVFLMIVIGRSIWKKKDSTHHYIDLVAGIIILLGVFALLIPTVLMLEGKGIDYMIPWLFNIGRTTLYHIGILIQILGMIYFAVTK